MRTNSYINNAWGDLYGLNPLDLSVELLNKLDFRKLLECLELDDRIPQIIVSKFKYQSFKNIEYIRYIESVKDYPEILEEYNKYIKNNSDKLNLSYSFSYNRSNIFVWKFLDDDLKKEEVNRLVLGKNAAISYDTLDYLWLYNSDFSLFEVLINKSERYFRAFGRRLSSERDPNLEIEYNNYVDKNRSKINASYIRDDFLHWNILNDDNKLYEVNRWVSGNSSIISNTNVDYNWLFKYKKEIAEKVVDKHLSDVNAFRNQKFGPVSYMISNIPQPYADRVMKKIFEDDTDYGYLKLSALANSNLSEENTLKALRVVAKRARCPKINVDITKSMLEKLPPITRLEVLEKLVCSKIKIKGLKNIDEFKALLFGSCMRYPDRAEKVSKKFEKQWSAQ